MGNGSKTAIKKTIESEMSVKVQNITENITKIVNETTMNVSTEMVQEMAASISTSVGGANVLKAKRIVAQGSDVDISQNAKVQAENQAIISIVSSAEAMQKLADKVAADVNNKVTNDNNAENSMKQAASISETTKSAGGPEGMLDSLTNMASDMMKSLTGSTSENETIIRQKINTDILNKTVNSQDLKNSVTNTIKNSMKQAAEAKCNMDTTGTNSIDVDDIIATAVDGKRGSIKIAQQVSVTSFNKCFIDLKMGQSIVSDLGVDKRFSSVSDTSNINKTKGSSDQEASIVTTKIQESAIMSSFDNLVNNIGAIFKISPMMMMMVVGGGICAAVAAYFYSTSKSEDDEKSDEKSSEESEQTGGFFRYEHNNDTDSSLIGINETELFGGAGAGANYGNIYLWALVAVLVYYIFGKSLPMSSVLVIVIISYIIYIIKNKQV